MSAQLDTNVIVEVLQRREPWFSDGQKNVDAKARLVMTKLFALKAAGASLISIGQNSQQL